MTQRGIIVGCDEKQEWLLPIWWSHYSLHSNLPVAFIDFGLSRSAKKWCSQKGRLIPFQKDIRALVAATNPPIGAIDSMIGSQFRKNREAWLKKPFACLMSPFKETIWIDIDCIIKQPVEEILAWLSPSYDLAIASEPESVQKTAKKFSLIKEDEILYNSGVIAFKSESKTIHAWINTLEQPDKKFPGDQDALSNAIYLNNLQVQTLPSIYNWPWYLKPSQDPVIIHYMGDPGKDLLKINKFVHA